MPALRTEAQKLASRLNGQKSRGPKTAEGKAISARNAIRHGLNSASVVLWCEKKEKYLEYLEDLTAEWQPETITELELVTALADAQWQLKRLTAIRTASIDLEMDRAEKSFREDFPASDETTRLALAWQALAVGSRYSRRAQPPRSSSPSHRRSLHLETARNGRSPLAPAAAHTKTRRTNLTQPPMRSGNRRRPQSSRSHHDHQSQQETTTNGTSSVRRENHGNEPEPLASIRTRTHP